ncbi:unnamed protein product [Peniophora sp. CBMAI 1063]|nr:unnamed protein product [Peniophora sp. CBMAI 1063]
MVEPKQEVIALSEGQEPTDQSPEANQTTAAIDDLLDDDVLREVFLYFPAQAHWKAFHPHEESTWLSITHVSRRWRTLSLSMPTIWSQIITTPAFWAPLCLERSQNAPIKIHLEWRKLYTRWNPSDQLVASVLGHLSHTRALNLESVPAPTYDRFVSLLKQPADELFEFHLQAETAQGLQPLTIPGDIFAGRVRHLRDLALEGLALRFEWKSPIFSSSLTRLSLTELSERVCRSELYAALRPMSELEHLRVANALHLVPSSSTAVPTLPPAGERVTLPKLKRISLEDHALDVCDFVGHLSLPPLLTIYIKMAQRDEHEDAVPSVTAAARVLSLLATPRASQPKQRCEVRHFKTDHFEVRMATPAENGDFREEKDHLNITFRWKAFNARVERAAAFLAILGALPLHAAHELLLSSRDPLSSVPAQDWAALGLFPSTEIVTLGGHAAYGFVHVLNTPGALPRMRKLVASNVHFASPTRSEGLGATLIQRLTEAPLEVLEIRSCNVAEEQVATFRRLCDEVKREGSANTWGAVGTSVAAMVSEPAGPPAGALDEAE